MILRSLFALLGSTSLLTAAPLALQPGEQLTYRVGWGLFGQAGKIEISARTEATQGVPQLHIETTSATRGLIRAFYPFDGSVESIFDLQDARLLAAKAETTTSRRRTQAMIVFDHAQAEARYVDYVRGERSDPRIPLPPEPALDLITTLVQARHWDLAPGDHRPIWVLFDKDFYHLVVHAEEIETLSSPWGEQPALRLEPRMETDPKGLFRRGGSVRVWISQDERRLPLKLEVTLKVGTAVAVLTDYRPPAPAARAYAYSRP